MLSKSQLLVIQYKALSYPYLSLNLKMFTLKQTIEIPSHPRGHTEVVGGPTQGNGRFRDSTKSNHSLSLTHTQSLLLSLRLANQFLPSFLSWLASAEGLESARESVLPAESLTSLAHIPAAPGTSQPVQVCPLREHWTERQEAWLWPHFSLSNSPVFLPKAPPLWVQFPYRPTGKGLHCRVSHKVISDHLKPEQDF